MARRSERAKRSRVLIAGCGYVGSSLGSALTAEGHEVWGLRRHFASPPEDFAPIEADLCLPATLGGLPRDLDFVFYMASPGGSDDALYRAAYVEGLGNLLEALEAAGEQPRRIVFVSSTSVYAQEKGEWVDESSETRPHRFGGRRLVEAEERVFRGPFSASVVRFGGIYGPRRTRLLDRVRTGAARYRTDPPQYLNRIHRDDCVGVLRHLMRLEAPERVYLAVDHEPTEEATLLNWLAGALGAPPPRPELPDAPRRRGNKRCRNQRLLASGYVFVHPTFREGYAALLADAE